jgi:hypothetical protein
MRKQRLIRSSFGALVALLCLAGAAATNPTGAGAAALEFSDASISLTAPSGEFLSGAGGHPDLHFSFGIAREAREGWDPPPPIASLRDMNLEMPPGFIGNPTAVPTCAVTDFFEPDAGAAALCPTNTQVGTARVFLRNAPVGIKTIYVPLYNLAHGPEIPARFGFLYLGVPALITPEIRPTDYGITGASLRTSQGEVLDSAEIILWGVPADAAHDTERALPGSIFIDGSPIQVPGLPQTPFLRNPTSCPESPMTFRAVGDSWESPGVYAVEDISSEPSGRPLRTEGCEFLPFDPGMSADVTSPATDSPTGLQVDIDVPQNEAPYGQSTSDVRKVVTTLPEGMSVSASSAQGLGACSQQQIGIGSNDQPTCPDSAKIGSVRIDTPLLEEQLEGSLYLAKQNDNPFGSLLALYMAVKGPGFYLKLPGKVDADPNTGQLTATFSDTPQLPFEHLRLELKSGARAPLTTPRECGTYAVKSEFVPWSGTAPVLGESKFTVSENCSRGFAPKLRAGTASAAGGSFSPFNLQVTREDGEPNLSKIEATLPEGLLAKLKGVPLCGDAQAATGDCPAASQVGTVTVGAGSGPNPLYVPEAGKAPTAAYLAGPFKGAPYSLVVKVPAQAGPFDLGTVAVRNALNIDPTTAQVTASSDPLPQILQGIPIAYRDVRVEVNRPDFTINPTSCKAMAVTSSLTSATGQTATPSSPFQASGCKELGFKPKLKISLKGKMNRTGNPALKAVLKAPKGDANIAKTTVILPKSQFIDNSHINNPCTRVQFNANDCPAGSILGKATAYTPLLDKPLSGPVYFRSNGGDRELPDLVADLKGQIHVTLVGFIDTAKSGGVRTRFADVPDAPVSKFVLKLSGGKKGLIENSRDLCSFTPKAKVQMTGQNGKTANSSLKLGTSCGKKKPKK